MDRPLTVLVIDDDVAVVEVIRAALEEEGCCVLDAVGAAGVARARAERPDVILLDVLMPRKSGVEVSQALRERPETSAIPIVSMSAHMQARTPVAMLADAHLAKPFDVDALLATVRRWAERRSAVA